MATNGSSDVSCGSRATRCLTLGAGLDKAGVRRFIHLAPGTYTESVLISGKAVTIVAHGATLTTGGAAGQDTLAVRAGSDVTVRGLRVTGAPGGVNFAVICASETGAPTRLSVSQVHVVDNGSYGVEVHDCDLTMDRSLIARNGSAGLSISSGSTFSVTNNFIVGNQGGGVYLGPGPLAMPTGRFEFNTVSQNMKSASSSLQFSGIFCNALGATSMANNIIHGNTGAPNNGGCPLTYSVVEGGTGMGIIDMDPLFVSPGTGDFHIMRFSPARNSGDDSRFVPFDYDGDPRPAVDIDMGADESIL
ncbi:MAG: right-handed parallel beta-helix repeat-containing protein [Deltaproteobacteria bacterium]|nr:right-handed parallel beta-helix repeat-containing protein [Deltaproteobacteria bacterium]